VNKKRRAPPAVAVGVAGLRCHHIHTVPAVPARSKTHFEQGTDHNSSRPRDLADANRRKTQLEASLQPSKSKHPKTEMMMPQRAGIPGTSLLNFEAWRALLRTICGRYNPEGIEPNAFIAGFVP
jgi:hypothetical protein